MKKFIPFILIFIISCKTNQEQHEEVTVFKNDSTIVTLPITESFNIDSVLSLINQNSSSDQIDSFNINNDSNFEITNNLKLVDTRISDFICNQNIEFKARDEYRLKFYYFSKFRFENYFVLLSTMIYNGKKVSLVLFEINGDSIKYKTKISDLWSAAECLGNSNSYFSLDSLILIDYSYCYDPDAENNSSETFGKSILLVKKDTIIKIK